MACSCPAAGRAPSELLASQASACHLDLQRDAAVAEARHAAAVAEAVIHLELAAQVICTSSSGTGQVGIGLLQLLISYLCQNLH